MNKFGHARASKYAQSLVRCCLRRFIRSRCKCWYNGTYVELARSCINDLSSGGSGGNSYDLSVMFFCVFLPTMHKPMSLQEALRRLEGMHMVCCCDSLHKAAVEHLMLLDLLPNMRPGHSLRPPNIGEPIPNNQRGGIYYARASSTCVTVNS